MAITNKTIVSGKGFDVTCFKVVNVHLNNVEKTVSIQAKGFVNDIVSESMENSVYDINIVASAEQDAELYAAVIAYAEGKVAIKIDEINNPQP